MIGRDCAARRTIAVKLPSWRSDGGPNAVSTPCIVVIPPILTVQDPIAFGLACTVHSLVSAAWRPEGSVTGSAAG
jgi:hypothetical protein